MIDPFHNKKQVIMSNMVVVTTILLITQFSCICSNRLDPKIVSKNLIAEGIDNITEQATNQVSVWEPVRSAIWAFRVDVGRNPTHQEGLTALLRSFDSWTVYEITNWDGPYIEESLLTDPWGNPLGYRIPSIKGIYTKPSYRFERINENKVNITLLNANSISTVGTKARYYPDEYDLWTMGPDGKDNTGDEIGNWRWYKSEGYH